jgi:hypothetical protein
MIWTAGSTRQMHAKAKIGFHGAYTVDKRGRIIGGASSGNALIGSYYAHLGLSDMAIMYMTNAGPNEVRWLTQADAKKFGLDVYVLDEKAENFIVGPWPKEGPKPLAPTQAPVLDRGWRRPRRSTA